MTSAVINIGYLNINEISNFGPAFYIYSLLIIQLFLFMSHQIPNIPRDCFCINLHQYFLKSITFRFKVFHHRNMKKLTTNHRSYRNHLVYLSIFLVSKLLLNRWTNIEHSSHSCIIWPLDVHVGEDNPCLKNVMRDNPFCRTSGRYLLGFDPQIKFALFLGDYTVEV